MKGLSIFLFGPRGVGKTSLVESALQGFSDTHQINLLHGELFRRYLNQPELFRQEITEKITRTNGRLIVFIDEIQKIPALLDEVHSLIETEKERIQFVMTGSSARKLRRAGANLLGGRAATLYLHPISSFETELNLQRTLQYGSLPGVALQSPAPELTLKSYVDTYLKEEILQEALVRNVGAFVRFIDVAGQMNGEPLNFSEVARDTGVSTKTAQEYFQILIDTLVVFRIEAWSRSIRKQLRQSPKFYFFDCGVLNAVRGELSTELKPNTFRYGKLFETLVVIEAIRLNDYRNAGFRLSYWRTNAGTEVDLVLSPKSRNLSITAIEIKSRPDPSEKDCGGLLSFASENKGSRLFCLCTTPEPYKLGAISVLPWKEGLKQLFPG